MKPLSLIIAFTPLIVFSLLVIAVAAKAVRRAPIRERVARAAAGFSASSTVRPATRPGAAAPAST
jgi:hypothetical protein